MECHEWEDVEASTCETHVGFTADGDVTWKLRFESTDCDGNYGVMRIDVDLGRGAGSGPEGDRDRFEVSGWEWRALMLNESALSVDVDLGDSDRRAFLLNPTEPFPE